MALNTWQRGLTLIELMITLLIVSVVAMLAVVSYAEFQQRARRVDAHQSLDAMANAQEKYFAANNSYATNAERTDLSGLEEDGGGDLISLDEHYVLTIEAAPRDALSGGMSPFTENVLLVATPHPTGKQAGDSACTRITLDMKGNRRSSDTTAPDECW